MQKKTEANWDCRRQAIGEYFCKFASLPSENIIETWNRVKENVEQSEESLKFVKYFEKQDQ